MSTFAAIGFLVTVGAIVGAALSWRIHRDRFDEFAADAEREKHAAYDVAASKIAAAIKARDDARRKAQGATIERDRLARIVRRYDRCRCGWFRHHHDGPGPIACAGFDLVEPADPLETIVDGEPFAESLGELASSGN